MERFRHDDHDLCVVNSESALCVVNSESAHFWALRNLENSLAHRSVIEV